MKPTEQYFYVVLFVLWHKVVLKPRSHLRRKHKPKRSVNCVQWGHAGISINITERLSANQQVLSLMRMLTMSSQNTSMSWRRTVSCLWNETSERDHSNESYWAVLSCGAVYYAVQGSSIFWVCKWNLSGWPFKWELLSSTLMWFYFLLCCTKSSNPCVWPFKWKLLSSTLMWYCYYTV